MKAYIWQSYHRRFSPLEAITSLYQYLSAEDNKTYLPNIVTSTLKSIVAESDHRQNRMIFKLAVELAEPDDFQAGRGAGGHDECGRSE